MQLINQLAIGSGIFPIFTVISFLQDQSRLTKLGVCLPMAFILTFETANRFSQNSCGCIDPLVGGEWSASSPHYPRG
jgi:hypothetical protein